MATISVSFVRCFRRYTVSLSEGGVVLDELKTLPEHRRRGAGSKLLQWGLDLADREQLDICLIAMPLGLELYEKYGFERLHEVSVDLSKYGGDTTFTWVFMLRKPRAATIA